MTATAIVKAGRLEVDPGANTIKIDGRRIPARNYVVSLIAYLADHIGETLTYEQLMQEFKVTHSTLILYMVNVRPVVREAGYEVRSVRNQGYLMKEVN